MLHKAQTETVSQHPPEKNAESIKGYCNGLEDTLWYRIYLLSMHL